MLGQSICSPEDLAECTFLISRSSILMSVLSLVALTLCRYPIIINSVLVIFRLSLFVMSQSLRFFSSDILECVLTNLGTQTSVLTLLDYTLH